MRYVLIGMIAMAVVLTLFDAFGREEPKGMWISEEQVVLCQQEGGCLIVSKAFLQDLAKEMQRLRSMLNKSCA